MTITRANAEAELVGRAGGWMSAAELSTSAIGANSDLQSPLAFALRKMGISHHTPITDADLSSIADEDLDQLYDLAELRLLKNVQRNFAAVDIQLGPRRESYDQLGKRLESAITALEAAINKQYGVSGSTITAGVLRVDFAEHDDGTSIPELDE